MDRPNSKGINSHSTVSNKDYMSNLGRASGVDGLEKKYKDLDDMISSAPGRKLPFWVKEVDEPTVEIDWDLLDNFPSMFQTCFNPEVYGEEEYFQMCDKQREYNVEWMKNKVPGHSIQDNAIANASNWIWKGFEIPWTGPKWETNPLHQVYYTPDEFGVPRYEGTPEQNARLIRVADRVFGSPDVGFVKLTKKTKKLLFGSIRFENVEDGYDPGDGTKVLPDKDLWVICSAMPQSLLLGKATSDSNWAGTNGLAYSFTKIYSGRLLSFLRSLGYQSYGGDMDVMGSAIGFGVMSGLGEYSRMGQMLSPFFGSMFRTNLMVVTDLPLAETKPIDAGMLRFCKKCKKCATTCPSGAISHKDEPFWGGDDPWHNKGIKGYYIQGRVCFTQMFKYPTNCGTCQTVCPFNKQDIAFIHKLIKMSIRYLPVFNKFIAVMDDIFGYGLEETEPSLVWNRDPKDIPLYGLDESRS
jgi:reductive dehalogenase